MLPSASVAVRVNCRVENAVTVGFGGLSRSETMASAVALGLGEGAGVPGRLSRTGPFAVLAKIQ